MSASFPTADGTGWCELGTAGEVLHHPGMVDRLVVTGPGRPPFTVEFEEVGGGIFGVGDSELAFFSLLGVEFGAPQQDGTYCDAYYAVGIVDGDSAREWSAAPIVDAVGYVDRAAPVTVRRQRMRTDEAAFQVAVALPFVSVVPLDESPHLLPTLGLDRAGRGEFVVLVWRTDGSDSA